MLLSLCLVSGLGKTQWCFSVCAKAFLPLASGGLGGGTIWIDTEGAFSVDRLVEVAQTRHPEYFAGQKERVRDFAHSVMHKKLVGEKDMHIALLNALGKVEELILAQNLKLVRTNRHADRRREGNWHLSSSVDLEVRLQPRSNGTFPLRSPLTDCEYLLPLLSSLLALLPCLPAASVLQLVIDGIAATVRTQTDRHETLGQIASALKLLSEKLNIAVIVTNQVTTKWTASKEGAEGTGQQTNAGRIGVRRECVEGGCVRARTAGLTSLCLLVLSSSLACSPVRSFVQCHLAPSLTWWRPWASVGPTPSTHVCCWRWTPSRVAC